MPHSNPRIMNDDPITAAITAAVARAVEPLADELAELRRQLSAPVPPPALLDRRGLARELGVSLATVDRLRGEGLPELRVCDAPRFELAEALSWLRARDEQHR
jgi:hypothetical protein